MASNDLVPERLDDLIVARLAHGPGVRSAAAMALDLRAFAPARFDPARWQDAVEEALRALQHVGRIVGLVPTEDETRDLATRLDLRGRRSWKEIRTKVIPVHALGLPERPPGIDKLKDRESWSAAIVARSAGLWDHGPPPSLGAVCDALVWRSLKLAGKAKRTPPEVRAHFLLQILTAGSGPPRRLLPLLAAREVGASRADLNALRDALVRRWLQGLTWATTTPTIDAFASAVRDSANRATSGVFGDRKVFISSLWQGMRSRPPVSGMSLDDFKHQLVLAHRAGLVELARADLTAAMDSRMLGESETVHLEARYHFVERGGLP